MDFSILQTEVCPCLSLSVSIPMMTFGKHRFICFLVQTVWSLSGLWRTAKCWQYWWLNAILSCRMNLLLLLLSSAIRITFWNSVLIYWQVEIFEDALRCVWHVGSRAEWEGKSLWTPLGALWALTGLAHCRGKHRSNNSDPCQLGISIVLGLQIWFSVWKQCTQYQIMAKSKSGLLGMLIFLGGTVSFVPIGKTNL